MPAYVVQELLLSAKSGRSRSQLILKTDILSNRILMFQQPSPTRTAETHFCGVISVVASVELPLTQSQLRQLDSPITAGPGALIFEQTGDEKITN